MRKLNTVVIVVFFWVSFVASCAAVKKQREVTTSRLVDSSYTLVTQRIASINLEGDKAVATFDQDSFMKLIGALRPKKDTIFIPGAKNGVLLKLYRDQFNQLITDCSAKDQVIQKLLSDTSRNILKYQTDFEETTIAKKTNYSIWFMAASLLLSALIFILLTISILRIYGKTNI